MNWVEKRKKTEENLAADIEYIWRDVKQALENATRSFNAEYEGSAEAVAVNGHRFRILINSSSTTNHRQRTEIDVDFDRDKRTLKADSPNPPVRYVPVQMQICADPESAFVCDEQGKRVTAEEFSQKVLEPIFFPEKSATGSNRLGRLV